MKFSPQVDAWFAAYDNPMKATVQRVRELVLGADPRIEECVKWQAPTFTYRGNLASFFPKSKQAASLMFHLGAKIPGRHPRLVGTSSTGRVLRLGSVAEANAARRDIERIVKAWCDWRDEEPARRRETPPKGRPSASKKRRGAKKGAPRA